MPSSRPPGSRCAAGAALLAIGLVMLLSSGLRVLKAFRERRLLAEGFFAVFPNPMYAAYVLLLVLPAEDRWLREKFAEQYEEYRRRVLVKFF